MRKKHLLYITALSVILSVTLIGSALISHAAPKPASVTFQPNTFTWGQAPPDLWKATIKVSWYTFLIDKSSILLEGVLKPVKTENKWSAFYAYFTGSEVVKLIEKKLPHEEPGTFVVPLTITGKIYWIGTFSGTGTITVTVSAIPQP